MDKKKIITISLFSIFLLLGAILSIAYAYFKARVSNLESSSTISIEAGEMSITYEGITGLITANKIVPNWSTTKTFTLKGINNTQANNVNNDNNLYYKIGIVVDNNTFSEGSLTYTLNKDSSSSSNGQMADSKTGTIPSSGTKFIATGYFSETSTEVSHTYNLTIAFPDTGEDQSEDQEASFACHLTVEQGANSAYIIPTLLELYSSTTKTNGITEDGLEIDDTPDKNLRYVGANPNNYVTFNDEIWRIIGVFNNVTSIDENGNEKTESLVKIIRNDILGNYSWDTSESTINSGTGINEWRQADLMYELNCDSNTDSAYCRDDITDGYLSNLTSGTTKWYNGTNNLKTGTYYFSKNIKKSVINKIAKVRWNLGGYGLPLDSALNMYIAERGTLHVSDPSDKIVRYNTWDGKIALMYPSDYGYASTGTACRNKLNKCNDDDSKANNWLFIPYQWTLSPYTGGANYVFFVDSVGRGDFASNNTPSCVRPTLFLKSDVMITYGDGSSTNPYKILIGKE